MRIRKELFILIGDLGYDYSSLLYFKGKDIVFN
jgi:hypothetical protein